MLKYLIMYFKCMNYEFHLNKWPRKERIWLPHVRYFSSCLHLDINHHATLLENLHVAHSPWETGDHGVKEGIHWLFGSLFQPWDSISGTGPCISDSQSSHLPPWACKLQLLTASHMVIHAPRCCSSKHQWLPAEDHPEMPRAPLRTSCMGILGNSSFTRIKQII